MSREFPFVSLFQSANLAAFSVTPLKASFTPFDGLQGEIKL